MAADCVGEGRVAHHERGGGGGTSADVKIWDQCGPQRTKGCSMEFEVGIHDDACEGRLHSRVPSVGRKTLTVRQKTSDDIHGGF